MKSEIEAYEDVSEKLCELLAEAVETFQTSEEFKDDSPVDAYAAGCLFGFTAMLSRISSTWNNQLFCEILRSKLIENDLVADEDIQFWSKEDKAGEGF